MIRVTADGSTDAVIEQVLGTPPEGKPIDLGDPILSRNTSVLIAAGRRDREVYSVRWHGTKVPRCCSVDGIPIVGAQHGQVVGTGGVPLGTYGRLVEFGEWVGNPSLRPDTGFDPNEQWIVIYVRPEAAL